MFERKHVIFVFLNMAYFFNTKISSSSCFPANDILLSGWIILYLCLWIIIYIKYILHSFCCWLHVRLFQNLAIVNSVTVNMGITISLYMLTLIPLGIYSGVA
jgi:hypothetical protein